MKLAQITLKPPINDNMPDIEKVMRKLTVDVYESCIDTLLLAANEHPDMRAIDFVYKIANACHEMLTTQYPEIYQ